MKAFSLSSALVVLEIFRLVDASHVPPGAKDVASIYKNVKTIVGPRSNIRGHHDRMLQWDLVKTRCFTECVTQNMTPEACVAYIEQVVLQGGGHEVGDLSIKIHEPRTELEFQASYWMMEVPVNFLGRTTCDRNSGIVSYPFPWMLPNGSTIPKLDNIDCLNLTAGQCCQKMRAYAQIIGRDVNGQCFSCFPHLEPLIPVTTDGGLTVQFEDYLYDGSNCIKVPYTEGAIQLVDQSLRQLILQTVADLNQFLLTPTCTGFGILLAKLYDVSRVVPQLPQFLGRLSCQYCFDSQIIPDILAFKSALLEIRSFLFPLPIFDSTERCVIIYTDGNGNIIDFPKVGGSRADDPFDDDCDQGTGITGPNGGESENKCMIPNVPESAPFRPNFIFDDGIFDYTCTTPRDVDRSELPLDYSVVFVGRMVVNATMSSGSGSMSPMPVSTQFAYRVCTAAVDFSGPFLSIPDSSFNPLAAIERVTLGMTGRCVVTDFHYHGLDGGMAPTSDFPLITAVVAKDPSSCISGFIWASKWTQIAANGWANGGEFCRELMLYVDGDVPAGPVQASIKADGGFVAFDVEGPRCDICN